MITTVTAGTQPTYHSNSPPEGIIPTLIWKTGEREYRQVGQPGILSDSNRRREKYFAVGFEVLTAVTMMIMIL
jgi:hypothetical protein